MKYRVRCPNVSHSYDTLTANLDKYTAINSARMHSLIPCNRVEVTDENGNQIEWRDFHWHGVEKYPGKTGDQRCAICSAK